MTKESLVSFCWRLIPYWLNSWEQQWGAECSSVMFELPHFAMELLVVLPCVQVWHHRQPVSAVWCTCQTDRIVHSEHEVVLRYNTASTNGCPFCEGLLGVLAALDGTRLCRGGGGGIPVFCQNSCRKVVQLCALLAQLNNAYWSCQESPHKANGAVSLGTKMPKDILGMTLILRAEVPQIWQS